MARVSRFTPDGTALQSVYEAFRFTESYGVIFQCNVKYCLGPCEPVSINNKKRVDKKYPPRVGGEKVGRSEK